MPNATVAAITMSSECDEGRLVARANLRLQTRVIGQSRPAAAGQLLGDPFGLVAARRIDDPGARLLREQRLQLLVEPVARTHVVADVRAVESGDDQPVVWDAELRQDVGAGALVRRRGQRQPGHVRIVVEQRPSAADSRGGNRGPTR